MKFQNFNNDNWQCPDVQTIYLDKICSLAILLIWNYKYTNILCEASLQLSRKENKKETIKPKSISMSAPL